VVTVYVFRRRDLRTPLVVAVLLAAYVVWRADWVGLVGLPLVYLGWCGCAPNLNLANGCLPVVATALAAAGGCAAGSTGLIAAAVACGVTWVGASLESAWRCRPEEW
jgi:hypothetical protein